MCCVVKSSYTWQGWLKGLNNTRLTTGRYPGKDGHSKGVNKYVSGDEYRFSLHYFNGDYKPIKLSIAAADYFDIKQTSSTFAGGSPEVFNGTIINVSPNRTF